MTDRRLLYVAGFLRSTAVAATGVILLQAAALALVFGPVFPGQRLVQALFQDALSMFCLRLGVADWPAARLSGPRTV